METAGREMLRNRDDVLVHSKDALVRAGMIAARLLVELGIESEDAIHAVRRVRKGAIETPHSWHWYIKQYPLPKPDTGNEYR